jgi:hypothetical protein
MSPILTAAVGSSPSTQTIDISAISTYKLAEKHQECEFVMPPNWTTRRKDLSAEAKLVHGFFNTRGGRRGYVDIFTREQIGAAVGLSLATTRRAIAELNEHQIILTLKRGNGLPAIHLLLPHPDMKLSADELAARRAKLPRAIQWRLDREIRRRSAGVITASPTQDHGSMVNRDDPNHGSMVSRPKEIKAFRKDNFKDMAMAGPTADTISTTCLPSTADAAPTAMPTIAEPPSSPKPTRAPKKPKPRRARSHHSLELCQRFAQAERDRKGTIESVKDFAESCYYTGRHDAEISRWLRKRAALEVGRYTPVKAVFAAPAPSVTPETPEQLKAREEAGAALRHRLQLETEIDAKREQAWAELPPDEQKRVIKAKLAQMQELSPAREFARWTAGQREAFIIERVKRELVPDPPELSESYLFVRPAGGS